MKSLPKSISANQFTLVLSIFYIVIFNLPVFKEIAIGITKQANVNWLFVASIPLFLICLLNIIFSIFTIKHLVKPFFIVLTIASSMVFFGSLKYGIIFDYGMMENIFQTNQAEAMTYVNLASAINLLLTGLLPAIVIYKITIKFQPFLTECKKKLIFIVVNLLIALVIAALFFQNYAAFGRNNSQIKQLIVPTYFVNSLAKYINLKYLQTPLKFEQLGLDAKVTKNKDKPNLLVLVVGETARAKNFEYYGYEKPTDSYTKKQGFIAFNQVTSCGTATAVSLPCMFSRMDRTNYDARHAQAQDTLLDVLTHAGINVTWLDNDSGCKGVCKRVKHLTIDLNSDPKLCSGQFCYDQILVNRLAKSLTEIKQAENTLIVLHVIGSHGPTYFLRYPQDKRLFTPDCQRSDIQNCSHDALVNTYDNTIAYTDFILSEVVVLLKQQQARFDTGLIYLSDHGESLGEKGMYLHGAPYAFAPDEQTHVPLLTWFSPEFIKANGLNLGCIKAEAKKGGYSQDNLFDSVLGLMNVSTKIYRKDQDIFAQCRDKL